MLNFLRRGRGAGRNAAAESRVESAPEERAAEFWRRWDELLPEITSALADDQPQRVESLVSDLVGRVHPKLTCSLERGVSSAYALVVSGAGDPELRGYTDAWISAAPAPDAAWEYHDSVPPVPDPTQVTVHVGETPYALADMRAVAQVDESAGVVDVALHHPGFADVAERTRTALALMTLDATLGERLAMDRVGRIETAELEPQQAVGLLRLREIVAELASGDTLAG